MFVALVVASMVVSAMPAAAQEVHGIGLHELIENSRAVFFGRLVSADTTDAPDGPRYEYKFCGLSTFSGQLDSSGECATFSIRRAKHPSVSTPILTVERSYVVFLKGNTGNPFWISPKGTLGVFQVGDGRVFTYYGQRVTSVAADGTIKLGPFLSKIRITLAEFGAVVRGTEASTLQR